MCLACVSLDFTQRKPNQPYNRRSSLKRVMAELYLHNQDYQTTITLSEAGLELVNKHRDDTGFDLVLYVVPQIKTA